MSRTRSKVSRDVTEIDQLTDYRDTSGGMVYVLLTLIGLGLAGLGTWIAQNVTIIIVGLAIGGWGLGMLSTIYRNVFDECILRCTRSVVKVAAIVALPFVYFRWAAFPDWIWGGWLLLTILLLLWVLSKDDSLNLVNGFGTVLYGNYHHPERGLVQTKWFVIFFVPVLPVRSYEGIEVISSSMDSAWQQSSSLQMRPWHTGRFYWPQLAPCLIVWPLTMSFPWLV